MGVYKDILKQKKDFYKILNEKNWNDNLYELLEFLQFSSSIGYGSKKDILKIIKNQNIKKSEFKKYYGLKKIFINLYDEVKKFLSIIPTNCDLVKSKKVWKSNMVKCFGFVYKEKSKNITMKIKTSKKISKEGLKIRYISVTPFFVAAENRFQNTKNIDIKKHMYSFNENVKDITNLLKIKEKNGYLEIKINRIFFYTSSLLLIKHNNDVLIEITQDLRFHIKRLSKFAIHLKG